MSLKFERLTNQIFVVNKMDQDQLSQTKGGYVQSLTNSCRNTYVMQNGDHVTISDVDGCGNIQPGWI